jgi:hypothetical protein
VAFAAIKGDRIHAGREEHFDEPEWDADGYFLDTIATILDSIFLRPCPLMEPKPMPEDRSTMVANNFKALAAASGGGKPRPGKPWHHGDTKGVCLCTSMHRPSSRCC